MESRLRLQVLGVNIGLVEAVEEHDPIGARLLQLPGEVRERGEEGRELHGDRDLQRRFHRAHDVERAALDRGAFLGRIGGKVVDVQLERVGAGLLDL